MFIQRFQGVFFQEIIDRIGTQIIAFRKQNGSNGCCSIRSANAGGFIFHRNKPTQNSEVMLAIHLYLSLRSFLAYLTSQLRKKKKEWLLILLAIASRSLETSYLCSQCSQPSQIMVRPLKKNCFELRGKNSILIHDENYH